MIAYQDGSYHKTLDLADLAMASRPDEDLPCYGYLKQMAYDGERLVLAGLSAPLVGHSVIYGLSDNATSWWDNTLARHIGYRPQDSSEAFRAAVESRQPALDRDDPATLYQGGGFVTRGPYDD